MRHISGQCHCGNLRYALTWPHADGQISVRACACDYCAKHGAVWTSHPDARLDLTIADDDAVLRYRFGTNTADFLVCARCGILTAAVSVIDGGCYAVVNVNTFEDVHPAEFARTNTDFGGEDIPARLARRRRNWMPVTVATP